MAFYLSEKATKGDLKIASLVCYLNGIRDAYEAQNIVVNIQHPSLQKVLKGIRNSFNNRPCQKEPLLTEDLKAIIPHIAIVKKGQPYLIGIRDRALLLLGFAGAFRRSELVHLNIEDLKFNRDGFVALMRKSKTDQEGEGIEKAIPYGGNPLTCPVRALKDWLEVSNIQTGPLFCPINRHGQLIAKRLSGHAVALIVKRYFFIQKEVNAVSGHSLRAGFATSAAKNKVPEHLIMKQNLTELFYNII